MDLFRELVSIPDLINHAHFSLEAVMIQEEEVRRADGRGSWRRRGQSIHDRRLVRVVEAILFRQKEDFLRFLPKDLAQPFSNRSLAQALARPVGEIRFFTYCLRKMGLVQEKGKQRNELLFELAPLADADQDRRT
jgi:hypothetical protein